MTEQKRGFQPDRLRALRLDVEPFLSQSALGEAIGVKQKVVSAWEVGDDVPTYEHLILLRDYFQQQLEREIQGLPSLLFDVSSDDDALARRIADEEKRIEKLQARIDTFQEELADAPNRARDRYRLKIASASAEIDQAAQLVYSLKEQIGSTAEHRQAQGYWLQYIKERGGAGWLWEQSDTLIHEVLAGILGNYQLAVRDNQIIGLMPIENRMMLTRRKRGI